MKARRQDKKVAVLSIEKIKTLHIKHDPSASKNVLARLRLAAETRIPQNEEAVLWCSSYESMFRLLTPFRIEIISAIRDHEPRSIQELAQRLDRDLDHVHRELSSLAELGIVGLEETISGECEHPLMLFDKIVWESHS